MDGEGQPREKEKTNGLVGSKTSGGEGQHKKKRENKWISRCQKQGAGRANLWKK